jgi:hypothetical protein
MKKNTKLDLIKKQPKMNQNQCDLMNKMIFALTQQKATKPEVKPNPEFSSPKKEVT